MLGLVLLKCWAKHLTVFGLFRIALSKRRGENYVNPSIPKEKQIGELNVQTNQLHRVFFSAARCSAIWKWVENVVREKYNVSFAEE